MILYPAIDIYGGRAVRLVQGRFEDATTYHDDPLDAAQSWVDAGARYLHVVDLDGAKEGEPRSIEHLRRIVHGTGVPVQYGGGLRTVDAVRDALRAGAERAIVGTAAFRDVDFLDEILAAVRAADRRVGRRPRRPDLHRGLDGDDRAAGRRTRSAVSRPAAWRRSSTRTSIATASSRARTRTRSAQVADAVRGRFLYSGGIGRREDLRRWRVCARSTSRA